MRNRMPSNYSIDRDSASRQGDPGVSVEHEGLPRSVGNLDNSTNNPEIFPVINKLVSQYS